MPRRSAPLGRRRHRRPVFGLALAAFLVLGAAVNGGAKAQTTGSGEDQFGGYKLTSRGNGFLLSFDSPGLLPVGSPLFEVGLPEAQATGANGPDRYAMASLAYPGAILADLPAVIAQSGQDAPVPPYPVRTQSFFPSGPTSQRQEVGAASMETVTTAASSDGIAKYAASDLQGFFAMGSITVHANTAVEDGQVVSRLRSEISGVNILGVLTIDSVVTDLVANSDSSTAASAGTTTVSGARFLGIPVTIDADGVHTAAPAPAPGATTTTTKPGPLDPITKNIPPLGQVTDALKPVADGLSALITSVVGANGTLNDLLAQTGISVKVLDPLATSDGAQAKRTANGLLVEIRYNGRTTPLISQLLSLVPAEQLPSDSLIPQVPLNTSPQAMFNLLKETYLVDLAIAPGDVAVQASKPFGGLDFNPPARSSTASGLGSGSTGFGTAAPSLGGGGGGGGGTNGSGGLGDLLPVSLGGNPMAAFAALLLVALIGSGFGVGAARLADNTLAAASASCPDGREAPSATYGPGGGTS